MTSKSAVPGGKKSRREGQQQLGGQEHILLSAGLWGGTNPLPLEAAGGQGLLPPLEHLLQMN